MSPSRLFTSRQASLFALGLALALPIRLHAERLFSHYQKVPYETEQGLPQDEVHGIAQTPDGFLWFATRDGLARFDGMHFTVFRAESNPGLAHNVLGPLMVDHLGRLWISTLNGLSCYEHGHFRHYGREDGLPHEAVHVMMEDHAGKLWFGTWGGLAVFDGHDFRALTTKEGLPQNVVFALAEDQGGGIWAGTEGGGVAYLKNGSFRVFTTSDGLPSNDIDDVHVDRLGRVWVATEQGLARLSHSGRFEKVAEVHGSPWFVYEDHEGDIWVSTTLSLARLSPGENRFREELVAPGESAMAMFEDKDRSIWLATSHQGAICYRREPFVTYTKDDGLADNGALNFYEDSRGTLWIGTSNGLSQWFQGRMRIVGTNPVKVGEVRAVAEDHEHRIWVGTSDGLIRFDGTKWERIRTRPIPLPLYITALCVDRNDRIWIGSSEALFVWDHGAVKRITANDGLPGVWIAAIEQDGSGRVWAATEGGLASIESDQITKYTTSNGLLNNFVPSLYKAKDGTLWICTFNGLQRWKEGHFQSFTTDNGMPLNGVLHILEDNDGYFWIAAYQGLFRVAKRDMEQLAEGRRFPVPYEFLGPGDGFRINFSNPPNEPVMWNAAGGTLWFATTSGVVATRPNSFDTAFPAPTPLVESVLADGDSVTTTALKAGLRRVEFSFTAPTSQTADRLDFRYRLDGFDRDWHEGGAQRFASFTNLPKGNYRFRVSVRRSGGSWNTNEASVVFQILPHWYETWFFRLSCGLLVMLALWFAYGHTLRQTKQRLELVLAERSRVANELHDTLLQSLSGAAMQVRAALSHLNRGALGAAEERLSSALDQMGRSQTDARSAIWELTLPELNGNRLTEALQAQARQICGEGTKLHYRLSGSLKQIDVNTEEHLYRICIEAITNAARHSNASEVAVDLTFGDHSVRVCVQDNGCGFDPKTQASTNGSHFGLRSMQQRAKRCGGNLSIASGPGTGTKIQLEVPLEHRGSSRS